MTDATFQFNTEDFERLIWDAGVDTHAKIVALAIRWHMNHKTKACNPSIPRLAKMCRCDERTVKRCIKDIRRVLGIEITSAEGKSHTFSLRVFKTADEIAAMFYQEEWRRSHWLLLKKGELDEAVSKFRDALAGPPSGDVPPASHVPPTSGADNPPHPTQQPPSRDVPRTSINLLRTSKTPDEPGSARNGKAHQPKKRRAKKAIIAAYTEEFEGFWSAYRGLMDKAGGRARQNRNKMPKPDAFTAWLSLSEGDRKLACDVLPRYAKEAGEYMLYASNYLSKDIFKNYGEEASRKGDANLRLVAEYFMHKRQWDHDMVDCFGQPPGHPECSLPPDLINRARAMAELGSKRAGGYNA